MFYILLAILILEWSDTTFFVTAVWLFQKIILTQPQM